MVAGGRTILRRVSPWLLWRRSQSAFLQLPDPALLPLCCTRLRLVSAVRLRLPRELCRLSLVRGRFRHHRPGARPEHGHVRCHCRRGLAHRAATLRPRSWSWRRSIPGPDAPSCAFRASGRHRLARRIVAESVAALRCAHRAGGTAAGLPLGGAVRRSRWCDEVSRCAGGDPRGHVGAAALADVAQSGSGPGCRCVFAHPCRDIAVHLARPGPSGPAFRRWAANTCSATCMPVAKAGA